MGVPFSRRPLVDEVFSAFLVEWFVRQAMVQAKN